MHRTSNGKYLINKLLIKFHQTWITLNWEFRVWSLKKIITNLQNGICRYSLNEWCLRTKISFNYWHSNIQKNRILINVLRFNSWQEMVYAAYAVIVYCVKVWNVGILINTFCEFFACTRTHRRVYSDFTNFSSFMTKMFPVLCSERTFRQI